MTDNDDFHDRGFLNVLGIGRRHAVIGNAAPEIKTASRERSR
ncbi:hypothetical protein [Paraburkholderia caledonica]|nr:hypothetical protein [Paraburkholderia caledonica]